MFRIWLKVYNLFLFVQILNSMFDICVNCRCLCQILLFIWLKWFNFVLIGGEIIVNSLTLEGYLAQFYLIFSGLISSQFKVPIEYRQLDEFFTCEYHFISCFLLIGGCCKSLFLSCSVDNCSVSVISSCCLFPFSTIAFVLFAGANMCFQWCVNSN